MSRKFDELNNIETEKILSVPYKEYFEKMEISEEEKEKRIELAEKLEAVFVWLFLLILSGDVSEVVLNTVTKEKIQEVIKEHFKLSDLTAFYKDYAEKVASETVSVTLRNVGTDYFTSLERAMLIAENEANLLSNYEMQFEAVKNGFKFKTWITENDSRVRHTHKELHRAKIDILKPFVVGDSVMMFPKDFTLGASARETVNCRCVLKYSK